jgi:hypothetical protein
MTLPTMVPGESPQEGNKPQVGETSVEKSDEVVVPEKSAKTRVTPVESMEGRTKAEGKSAARNASSTQREQDALTCLQRIGERAKQKPKDDSLRTPLTQGGSPVRETRSPGSVRGAARKGRPYRDNRRMRSHPEGTAA